MKIPQLSLFLENKPGHLRGVTRTLAQAGINILTLSLADTQQFGILRLIVKEWERAQAALEQAGFVVTVTEVVATEVEDRPGGLNAILEAVDAAGLNIEYMYAFTFRRQDKALLVFRFDHPEAAAAALRQRGISVVQGVELFDAADQG